MDFYTFKSNFERIHKKVPKSTLRDRLVFSSLENPALLRVKVLRDIDDIWPRLQAAYGDVNILLKRKIAEIDSMEAVWSYKDPEKMIEGFSKIINLMRDLMNLAKLHKFKFSFQKK